MSEKNIFVMNFPFLTDLLRPPLAPRTPEQSKYANRDKSFLSMLPKMENSQ